MSKAVLFQIIQFSISTQFTSQNSSISQLNVKTVLFQTIQLSIGTQFSSI